MLEAALDYELETGEVSQMPSLPKLSHLVPKLHRVGEQSSLAALATA